MSRILVLGYTLPALIPAQNTAAPRAFNLRTAQLVEALLADGHQVLVCSRLHHGEIYDSQQYPFRAGSLACRVGGEDTRTWVRIARQSCAEFDPQAVVCTSLQAGLVATRLPAHLPCWIDIYGDPISDLQMMLRARGFNRGLRSVLWMERRCLRRGDRFSTCSSPQRFALIGKLAAVKRLEYRTLEYDFVNVILPARSDGGVPGLSSPAPLLASPPGEAEFRVLWLGGYNGWVDVDTLFEGLAYAMQREPRVRYVSLGEGIGDPSLYARFKQRVAGSPWQARFDLRGWQPAGSLPQYCSQSHLGISVLKQIYETELGAPTRVVEMLAAGLPVLTVGCELSSWLEQRGAALTSPVGDAQSLGEAILLCARDQVVWRSLAETGRRLITTELTPARTAGTLRQWAAAPLRAPDQSLDWRGTVEDRLHEAIVWSLWKAFQKYI